MNGANNFLSKRPDLGGKKRDFLSVWITFTLMTIHFLSQHTHKILLSLVEHIISAHLPNKESALNAIQQAKQVTQSFPSSGSAAEVGLSVT